MAEGGTRGRREDLKPAPSSATMYLCKVDKFMEANPILWLREAGQPQCSRSEFIFDFPVSPTLQSGLRR